MYENYDDYDREPLRDRERRDDMRQEPRGDRYDDARRDDMRRDDYGSRRDDRYYRDMDMYGDDEIREEIDRLRGELNRLKRTLEERKTENMDIKMAIKASETANLEVLSGITGTLQELAARLEEIDEEVGKNIKKVQSGIRDDMDELNLPVEAKCEAIEERIKSIQEGLTDNSGIKEEIQSITDGVNDKFGEKFGSKTIGDVLQKQAMQQTFIMANMVGTIMVLALMCYFIISLT